MNQSTGSGVTGSRTGRIAARLMKSVGLVVVLAVLATACSSSSDSDTSTEPLYIGGIPDQEVSILEERFNGLADYLSEETGIDVQYAPATDYASIVTAFENGDVLLGWFGGLTGVQARLKVDGAEAVVQRPIDEEFESVFIVGSDVDATSLSDLEGLTFTFGSESSTSGHLMPRYFLSEAGIEADQDFSGNPGYSGSHDQTWQLVESGSYQAGALNAAVWNRAVEEGAVDTNAVRVLEVTEPYYDYHWVTNPLIDERYGEGTRAKIIAALLVMGDDPDPAVVATLEAFQTDRFIATDNTKYAAIEAVARNLGLIE